MYTEELVSDSQITVQQIMQNAAFSTTFASHNIQETVWDEQAALISHQQVKLHWIYIAGQMLQKGSFWDFKDLTVKYYKELHNMKTQTAND